MTMPLQLTYTARNLLRNPLRTLLTCAAVGLPIVIFVLTTGVVDGIQQFLDNSSRQLRLAVTQKASIVNPLPAGHRAKIEALDPTHTRITAVCGFRWLGGKIENDPRPLSTVGADPDTFAATFPEHLRTPAERDAWLRDRQALVVGRATAAQFGWKVGDHVTIRPSVPPYTPMQFHVVSTAPEAADPITNFCRRDYAEEEIKRGGWLEGLVSFFFVKCATLPDLEQYRTAIDQLFANSPDETLTQDEKSFMNQFITQQFDLPRNLTLLAAITVLVAVLAATNTMSMNFRDRLSEYATLRAIGYRGPRILALIQAESLAVCLVGGVLGALGPYLAFTVTPLKDLTVPLIQHLEIRPLVCVYAIGIAAAIGVLAAAWPSWLAARLKVVEAFRMLE
jgi:putative ABC transport system permease protein